MLLFKKKSSGKKIKILIWSKEKNNFYFIFKSIFERQKQTYFNKDIQPNSNEKKFSYIYFLFTVWKKKVFGSGERIYLSSKPRIYNLSHVIISNLNF
jgi:hypothetical protein